MISQTAVHALRAVACLANLRTAQFAGAAEIADAVGAPANYLGKILKRLAEHGILESQRGFKGGFRLAYPAARISLLDVLEPIEGMSRWNGCFIGKPKCTDRSPCSVHTRWSKVRDHHLRFLRETAVAALAR